MVRVTDTYESFDFAEFIEGVKDRDYLEIIRYAEQEADRVDRMSRFVKGAVTARRRGSITYVSRIGAFLFWMRFGIRPDGASEQDFQSYRVVAERLVQKGQFKPEALDAFRTE
jgi:hypothetical protein